MLRNLATTTLLSFLLACGSATSVDDVGDESAESALGGPIAVGASLVTTTTVNFRSGPSTASAVIRTLPKGTVVVATQAAPQGKFYAVRSGADAGWVHGAYLTSQGATPPVTPATPTTQGCTTRRLRFSADALPGLPSGTAWVWGGNATDGEAFIDPPYSGDFRARAAQAHQRGQLVFAYLEGPCGDTGGVDDGERARCANIHDQYNRRFAPGTPGTPQARWKPYTMKQLTTSGANDVDFCEIDNLENNVTIPLNPLMREIKALYDAGSVHCRIVLKNVSVGAIDSLRANVAPTPAAADFLAPFHIYEADGTSEKPALDAAMRRLKGPGAVTIISTDTNHYGSAFTQDSFETCP